MPVHAVACSSYNSLEFVAAGSLDDASDSKLKIYEIDPVTSEMAVKHDFVDIKKDDKISDIVYSSTGTHFYRCGSVGIFKTNANTYLDEPVTFPVSLKNFVKIRVSSSEDVLVVSDDNQGLYINKKDPAISNSLNA